MCNTYCDWFISVDVMVRNVAVCLAEFHCIFLQDIMNNSGSKVHGMYYKVKIGQCLSPEVIFEIKASSNIHSTYA